VKGQEIMVRISLLTFPVFSCRKWKKNICPNKTFLENYFFQVQQLKGTMKFQVRAIHWG
jgi:hypothetical protein